MLDTCAKGYSQRLTDHYYRVSFNKKIYPSLPRGEHGKGDKEIELGHVLKMAKSFDVLACAQEFFGIGKKAEEGPPAATDPKTE